jgi:hypothetical protein
MQRSARGNQASFTGLCGGVYLPARCCNRGEVSTINGNPPTDENPRAHTNPPEKPAPPGRPFFPLWAKIFLFAVLPILIAVALVATVLSAVLRPAASTNQQFDLAANAGLAVSVGNATLDFVPSSDDRVHVEVSGFSWGNDATVESDDSGSITELSGGCRGGWFSFCRMSLEVALPADLPLLVRGTNGSITVEDLTGDLELQTSNGAVDVSGSAGILDLRSTNGGITLDDSTSARVEAATTNGRIDLTFDEAPRSVAATSTNGGVSIRVPDDGEEYRVEADTVNGGVDADSIPADDDSARTITAQTTNGGITIGVDG